MRFAIITKDKAGALQTRLDNREAHLAYLSATGAEMAGPFLDAEGNMAGSLVVIDLPDRAAAESWAANDPYTKADLFADVRIEAWKKVIG